MKSYINIQLIGIPSSNIYILFLPVFTILSLRLASYLKKIITNDASLKRTEVYCDNQYIYFTLGIPVSAYDENPSANEYFSLCIIQYYIYKGYALSMLYTDYGTTVKDIYLLKSFSAIVYYI